MNPEAFGRRLGSTLRATRSHSEALGFRQQNNSIDFICVKKKNHRGCPMGDLMTEREVGSRTARRVSNCLGQSCWRRVGSGDGKTWVI